MKKVFVVSMFLVFVLALSADASTEMIANGEFDDFSGVPWYSWTGGIWFYDDAGDSICSYGWWDGANIYQNTGYRLLANATYVMQARVRAAEGAANEWGEGIIFSIQGVVDSGSVDETWTEVAASAANMFPEDDFDDPFETGIGPWREYSFVYDSSTTLGYAGQQLGAALVQVDSSTPPYNKYGDYGWIHADYVRLMALVADAPVPANDFSPHDGLGAAGMPGDADPLTVDVELQWSTAIDPADPTYTNPNPNVTNHYLYLKEDLTVPSYIFDPNWFPDFTGVTPIPLDAGTNSYIATGLNYDSTYIWKVEEGISGSGATDPATLSGNVWVFETISKVPVIIDEPNDVLVQENDSAAFEVVVFTITGESYQWYTSTDNIADPGGADPAIPDATSSTLTLSSIPLTDAGTFVFCVITNDDGSTNSRLALIEVERQMGHWKLDGTVFDSGVYGYHGTMADPNYAAGIDADAMEFFGNGEFIEITGSTDDFNNYHLGMTVSAWVNSGNTNWNSIAAKQNRDGDVWTGWVLVTQWQGIPQLDIRGLGGPVAETVVTDDQWHLVTATFDGGITRLYVDGMLEGETDLSGSVENDNPVATDIPLTDRPVTIGAEDINGGTSFSGLIDDVQMYNYAIPHTQVVDMYNDFIDPDINPCIADIYAAAADISGPEGEPDCRIDIHDFAEMAAGWLGCGLYPICP